MNVIWVDTATLSVVANEPLSLSSYLSLFLPTTVAIIVCAHFPLIRRASHSRAYLLLAARARHSPFPFLLSTAKHFSSLNFRPFPEWENFRRSEVRIEEVANLFFPQCLIRALGFPSQNDATLLLASLSVATETGLRRRRRSRLECLSGKQHYLRLRVALTTIWDS